jgi:multidrug efflux pump subunit AcrB
LLSGGEVTTPRENIVLEPTGNFESIEDLKRTLISIPGQEALLFLEDIAKVERGYIDPPQSTVRSNGVSALALAINMREGGNILSLGELVKEKITYLQTVYPIGIEFDFVAFQPYHVDRKVKDFIGNLLQAVGIVLIVMLLFLGLRTGLVVASLVPSAMIMSLMVMGFFDIGLDQMSLASLIIALGMLVDNAIVMSESIMVQMAGGKPAKQAAVDSASELRIPLLVSSLTTAAAFLPIYLAESGVGEYCAPLFKVVTITLLCSWLLSITMIPMLCVLFLRIKSQKNKDLYKSRFYTSYRSFLLALLRHRVVTVIAIFVIFFISLQGFALLPNIFFPPNDKAIYTAELSLPTGTPIERTRQIVDDLEAYMRDELLADSSADGITNWSTYIGQGPPTFVLGFSPEQANPGYACLIINATTGGPHLDTLIHRTESYCLKSFPDVRPNINRLNIGPPPDAPVSIRILGRDSDVIFQIADRVKGRLSEIDGVKDIHDDWGQFTKKLLVRINQARARRAGITNQDIALSLQAALSGLISTEYREDDKIIPITLRSIESERRDIGNIETLNVYSQMSGRNVPLKQVADLDIVWEPSIILRRDLRRVMTVKCGVSEEITPIGVAQLVGPWLEDEKQSWELGYDYEIGGEMESSQEASESINEKLPIAGLIIILLLVGQFNSIRRPFIILMAIPLGIIGVIIGLLVLKSYFGFMTLLGVISLAGVVINNAIVLLDRIRIEREVNGLEPRRAIVEAAQRRLRPIMLTTATTIGGLIPLYLGGGPMWEPMAVAIMFGLLFATVLTLGFVPVMYALLFRVRFKGFEYRSGRIT